jgi:hypothetical protein
VVTQGLHARGGAIVAIAALALTTFAGAAPLRAAPTVQGACVPQNQFMNKPGTASLSGHGKQTFDDSQWYPTPSQTGGTNLGDGTLTWNVNAQITGLNTNDTNGDLAGFLTLKIVWEAARPDLTFSSTCVAAVSSSAPSGGQGGTWSARYEGPVTNFPTATGVTPGNTTTVAEIFLTRISAKVADVTVTLKEGTGGAECSRNMNLTAKKSPAAGHKDYGHNGARTSGHSGTIFC